MVGMPEFNKAKDVIGDVKSVLVKAVGNAADAANSVPGRIESQVNEIKALRRQRAEENHAAKEPNQYEHAVIEYNDAYTELNHSGMQLLRQRERTTDLLGLIESLVNSIARTPKTFDVVFEEIESRQEDFRSILERYDEKHLTTARNTAAGASAGVVAGAGVAAIAPTAAMWVATTFGTASTGAAISSLSGAAASNAALAWLGGGTLAAGSGGMYAGTAFLALAGPVGWTIAGATVLTSVLVITTTRFRTKKEKEKVLSDVKFNTARTARMTAEVDGLRQRTTDLRGRLIASYEGALHCFGADFDQLTHDDQTRLASLVNSAKGCALLLSERFEEEPNDE